MSKELQWIDKYKPNNVNDIFINRNSIIHINNWLNNFESVNNIGSIIISGNHGVGKNISIELLLKNLNYEQISLSSSHQKNKKTINDILKLCNKSQNIYDLLTDNNNSKKYALVIDDTETITLKSEKNNLYELCKDNDKKKLLPIIFISNGQNTKFIVDLKKIYIQYIFFQPTNQELAIILNNIVKKEKINIANNKIMISIVKYAQNDIRRLINMLQDLFMTYGHEIIDVEKLQNYFYCSQKKNIEMILHDSTRQIIDNYKNINHCMSIFESQKVVLPLMVFENYYRSMFNREIKSINKDELLLKQLNICRRVSDAVSKGDVIETNIYTDQNWLYQNIHGYFAICDTSYSLNSIIKSEKPLNYKLQDYSTDLNRTSLKNINKKNISKLLSIIPNKTYDDILYINKLITKLVLKNKIKQAYQLCKDYPIDIKILETILKIDKTIGKIVIGPKTKKLFGEQ